MNSVFANKNSSTKSSSAAIWSKTRGHLLSSDWRFGNVTTCSPKCLFINNSVWILSVAKKILFPELIMLFARSINISSGEYLIDFLWSVLRMWKPTTSIRLLLLEKHGAPEHLRSDNGSEFIAKIVQRWLEENQIKTIYIDPGSPWQNGFVESFHGRFRDECLNREQLWTLTEARVVVGDFRQKYNQVRPHSRLGYESPAMFAAKICPSPAGDGQGTNEKLNSNQCLD